MTYHILNRHSVLEYVRRHPRSSAVLDLDAALESEEIGDGNLNLVFRVFEPGPGGRSVLLKQALPYLRVAGEGWPLSSVRAGFEARALEHMHRAAPGRVPRPLWFDEEMALNAMEDLREHRTLRLPLVQRVRFPGLGRTVGEFLAATLFESSDFALPYAEKMALAAGFQNSELCELTEALIFTEPFYPPPNRNRYPEALEPQVQALQADAAVRAGVAELKRRFRCEAQALLHGDLHTGSLMATLPDPHGRCDLRIIDPEFACLGPMGFDLGLFFANLLLSALALPGHGADPLERERHRAYLLEQLMGCWNSFEVGFRARLGAASSPSWREPAFQDAFLCGVLRDSAGFAGCELVRRTIGFAHVLDLESIPDADQRYEAERRALALGRALILAYPQLASLTALEALLLEHLLPEAAP